MNKKGGTSDPFLRVFDPDDPDRASELCVQALKRVTNYLFAKTRNWADADELASETMRRGFARIAAGAEIYVDPVHYFLKIAKYVVIEKWRAPKRETVPLDAVPEIGTVDFLDVETRICLEQHLRLLPSAERETVWRYLFEDHGALARSLGLKEGTLRVRVHRTVEKLIGKVRRANAAVQAGETKARVRSLKE